MLTPALLCRHHDQHCLSHFSLPSRVYRLWCSRSCCPFTPFCYRQLLDCWPIRSEPGRESHGTGLASPADAMPDPLERTLAAYAFAANPELLLAAHPHP